MDYGPHTIAEKGTLYEATQIALSTHWKGTRWGEQVPAYAWPMVAWFQDRNIFDLDQIGSDDIDAFVRSCRGNAKSTILKKVGVLRTIWEVANKRRPKPLAKGTMPSVSVGGKDKTMADAWWLRPEALPMLTNHLIDTGAKPLALYILWTVNTGLRVEENLALTFNDVHHDTLWVPGTKTSGAQATLPLSDAAKIVWEEIKASTPKGTKPFPWSRQQLLTLWHKHVIPYLKPTLSRGQKPVPRDLRATFASMMHSRGMPTEMLRQLLRHSGIQTTQRYIRKTGDIGTAQALAYMNNPDVGTREVALNEVVQSVGWKAGEMALIIAKEKKKNGTQ